MARFTTVTPGSLPWLARSLWFAGFLSLAATAQAFADQTDRRLGSLFATLKETHDPGTGEALTERIWAIWFETEDAAAQQLLVEGMTALEGEHYPDALAAFTGLVELAPGFAEGWNRRATLYYLMGDFDASVRDIERTLALEPRHFGALSGLGLIYLRLGDEAAALKAFQRALELDPALPGVRQNIERIEQHLKGRPV